MPSVLWSAPVGPLGIASGPAVTAAALTDGSPPPPAVIEAGMLSPGTEMRVRAHGEYTCSSATPTLTLGVYWGTPGAAISGAVVIASGITAVLSASAASWPWMLEWDGEFRGLSTGAGGNTGSINGMGKIHLGSSLTAFAVPIAFPATKALRTVALDTSVNKTVMLGITLSSVTGSPSVTCDDLIAELLG